MNLLRSTIAVVICLPAFLAFQTVSRPLMLCLQDSCEMAQCEMADAGPEQPCAMNTPEVPEPRGCCEKPEEPVSGCGGCEIKERPLRVANCKPDRTQTGPCNAPSDNKKDRNCPKPNPVCGPCIPIQLVAPVPDKSLQDESQKSPFTMASEASRALADADRLRGILHTHSPPIYALARSGPQTCTRNCSFLL